MPTVHVRSGPLNGGVSKQPPHLRQPNKVESADNVIFDIASGFYRRPGTWLDRKFSDTAGADFKLSLFVYGSGSSRERYIVRHGPASSPYGLIRAVRMSGNEATVTIAAAAGTYLALNTPNADQFYPRSINEYALWINSTVATATTTSDAYTLERTRYDYDAVVSFTTTANYYVRSENDSARAKGGYYQYTPGSLGYAHINFVTIATPWAIHYGYWDDATYGELCGFRIAFRRQALTGFTAATWTVATLTLGKTGAFTSYTYRAGDMIYLSSGTNLTAGWYAITGKTSADAITLRSATGLSAGNEIDWAANVTAAAYSETNICRIGMEVEATVNTKSAIEDGTIKNMDGIALKFQDAIRAAGAANACVAWVPQQAGGGAFQITGPYRSSESVVYAPSSPSSASAAGSLSANGDLTNASGDPFYNTGTDIHIGTGTLSTSSDSETPESRWTRVAAPGQTSAKLDATKMPHKMTRTSANNLSVDAVVWTQRGSGDATSNPAPRLFRDTLKITDAAWYRNRIHFVGGTSLCASSVSDPLQFYLLDSSQTADDDRISRDLPGDVQSPIDHAIQIREALVLFTPEAGQFEVSPKNADVYSPSTAAVEPRTAVPALSTRPSRAGTSAFFAGQGGSGGQVYEYLFDSIFQAADTRRVTAELDTYLPTTCRSFAADGGRQTLAMLPDDDNQVFIYRWYWDGNRKLQSAWSRFTYDGTTTTSTGYRICDVMFIDGDLWLLVESVAYHTVTTGTPRLTITAHGLSDGNSIVLSNSTTTPSLNGTKYVDVIDANTVDIYDDAGLITPSTLTVGGIVRRHSGDYFLERQPLDRETAISGYPYTVHLDRRIRLTGSHAAGTTTWTLPSTPTVLTGSSQMNGYGSTINNIVEGGAFGTPGTVVIPSAYTTTAVQASGNYSAGECTLGRYFEVDVELSPAFAPGENGFRMEGSTEVTGVTVTHQNTCQYTVVGSDPSSGATRADVEDDFAVASVNTPERWGSKKSIVHGDNRTLRISITDDSPRPITIASVQHKLDYSPEGT